jgi:hypothetical protein
MSCKTCTNIVFRPQNELDSDLAQSVKHLDLEGDKDGEFPWENFVYVHHDSISDLAQSSLNCNVCYKLFSALKPPGPGSGGDLWKELVKQIPPLPIYLVLGPLPSPLTNDALYDEPSPLVAFGPLRIRSTILRGFIGMYSSVLAQLTDRWYLILHHRLRCKADTKFDFSSLTFGRL